MKKTLDLLVSAVLLLCVAVLAGCGDRIDGKDFIAAFSLDRNYYEVRLARGTTTVAITNGSGDLALEVADETVLQATYTGGLSADEPRGVIDLYGKRKGTTTLTVTDRITGDRQTVEVKVTDCYLACNIFDSNHPSLKAGTTLFWVNNPARDCYLFDQENVLDAPLAEGTYAFHVAADPEGGAASSPYGIPCLRLTGISASPCDLQIEMQGEDGSSPVILSVIAAYLDVDWEKLAGQARTREYLPIDMTLILTVPGTDYRIRGVLSMVSLPEHFLD